VTLKSILTIGVLGVFAAACGGTAAGLKHTISEKQLVGMSPESQARVEQGKGEVMRAQDAYTSGDFEIKAAAKEVGASDARTDSAADAVSAAADTIEAADDKVASELKQAQARRDEAIALAKDKYAKESGAIRERHEKAQTANRAALAGAKRSQELAAAEKALDDAELAEAKARGASRKQEVMVAKAKLEVVKLEELHKTTGVVGPNEQAQKVAFDAQLAGEQKKLDELNKTLEAKVKATAAAKAKIEAVKARSEGAPK